MMKLLPFFDQRKKKSLVLLFLFFVLVLLGILPAQSQTVNFVRNDAANPLSTTPLKVKGGATPTAVDLNGDDKLDLVIGSAAGPLSYFENTGTSTTPAFTNVTVNNPFAVVTGSLDYSAIVFADFDKDQDFDAIVTTEYLLPRYFENTGTKEAPAFQERTGTASPLNGLALLRNRGLTTADIDGDGDQDIIQAQTSNSGAPKYFENTTIGSVPSFIERTGLENKLLGIEYTNWITFQDLDGDGDLDGLNSSGTVFVRSSTGWWTRQDNNPYKSAIIRNGEFTLADFTGDNTLDFILGDGSGKLYYVKNTGTRSTPVFVEQTGANNPFHGFGTSYAASPEFADLDGDGDTDMLTGANNLWQTRYYRNTGTKNSPVFIEQNLLSPLALGTSQSTNIAIVDIDTDGDIDVFAGNNDSDTDNLTYYKNIGSAAAPRYGYYNQSNSTNPFSMSIEKGPSPTFADIDADGDLDALMFIEYAGKTKLFLNTGTRYAPSFALRTLPTTLTDVQGSPTFVDLDRDGDQDIVFGNYDGNIRYFENTGSAVAYAYTERTGTANPFNGIDVGDNASPAFADLDNDGDWDAYIGNNDGYIIYLENQCIGNKPTAAGAITAKTTVCVSENGVTFTVPAVTGAISYEWTLPEGATVIAGHNTTSITVNFAANAKSGIVSVAAANACGVGAASTLAITVTPLPVAGAITGSSALTYGQTALTYSITALPGVTYTWTVPAGLEITAGQGTNSITARVIGMTAGDVMVAVSNSCGAGTPAYKTVTIGKAAPTITFANITKTYGDDAFTLGATSNSGGTISYSVVTPGADQVTLSGSNNTTATIVKAGTVTLRATITATDHYLASSQDATLSINKATQVITFLAIANKKRDDVFTLPATTDKGLSISYVSSNSAVATVQGNTVTVLAITGSTQITASQTGDQNHAAAASVTQPLQVTVTSSAEEIASAKASLYPNPTADGKITITGLPQQKSYQVRVIDGKGREVKQFTSRPATAGTIGLDLSKLAAGQYTLLVQADKLTITKRIVKQ